MPARIDGAPAATDDPAGGRLDTSSPSRSRRTRSRGLRARPTMERRTLRPRTTAAGPGPVAPRRIAAARGTARALRCGPSPTAADCRRAHPASREPSRPARPSGPCHGRPRPARHRGPTGRTRRRAAAGIGRAPDAARRPHLRSPPRRLARRRRSSAAENLPARDPKAPKHAHPGDRTSVANAQTAAPMSAGGRDPIPRATLRRVVTSRAGAPPRQGLRSRGPGGASDPPKPGPRFGRRAGLRPRAGRLASPRRCIGQAGPRWHRAFATIPGRNRPSAFGPTRSRSRAVTRLAPIQRGRNP